MEAPLGALAAHGRRCGLLHESSKQIRGTVYSLCTLLRHSGGKFQKNTATPVLPRYNIAFCRVSFSTKCYRTVMLRACFGLRLHQAGRSNTRRAQFLDSICFYRVLLHKGHGP